MEWLQISASRRYFPLSQGDCTEELRRAVSVVLGGIGTTSKQTLWTAIIQPINCLSVNSHYGDGGRIGYKYLHYEMSLRIDAAENVHLPRNDSQCCLSRSDRVKQEKREYRPDGTEFPSSGRRTANIILGDTCIIISGYKRGVLIKQTTRDAI